MLVASRFLWRLKKRKKKEKTKSALPENTPLYNKDAATGEIIASLLAKYPNHKRVLFLQSKFENNEPIKLSPKESDLLKMMDTTRAIPNVPIDKNLPRVE